MSGPAIVRSALRIRGIVQGVGFRPAMCRFARTIGLAGFVRNESGNVVLEIEGDASSIRRFLDGLPAAAPPLARIDAVDVREVDPRGERDFVIEESAATAAGAAAPIPADVAPCEDCLRELSDPADRRHRYPFINCTSCGPRYTIIRDVPYDRARTTMERFLLCERCRREYEDPLERRFHAEPNACPRCGPRLTFLSGPCEEHDGDALDAAIAALHAHAIVAVKGVGGYVLAADATRDDAVERLRQRKRRPHKPFAVMARDLDHASRIALLDDAARAALVSPARPIVLAPARPGSPLAAGVAPGLDEVGVFLPPSPLQHLLLQAGPPLQVMTSGNVSDEPIVKDDDVARTRLGAIADALLVHDRPIHTRTDDSVVRAIAGTVVPVRRARGFVPGTLPLPVEAPMPVLAVGGELKNTVCLAAGDAATLSQHVGDLSHPEAERFFEETIGKLIRLLGVTPRVIAHDLHPEYRSTRWALAQPLRRIEVQHHHAHIAACLAENGRAADAIGVAFDGTGCGPGGALWGGEFLLANLGRFRRLGHLRPLALAGGEAAIRNPWRIALAALADAGVDADCLGLDPTVVERMRALLLSPDVSPRATGAGRWFDAVAAICGLRAEISYEAQAAIELEASAASAPAGASPYDFAITGGAPFVVDLRPAVRAIAAARASGASVPEIAARFHATMAAVVLAGCRHAREAGAPSIVALSGGCFQNRRLVEESAALLARDGFEVLLHRHVPPNDGGLAYGQAAVASYRLAQEDPDVSRHPR